eukprot:300795_1
MTVKYNDVNKIHQDITDITKTLSLIKKQLDETKLSKTIKSRVETLETLENEIKTNNEKKDEKQQQIYQLLDERQKIKKKLKDTKL